MLLIAVDESGYGPLLGPLVIAATVWEVPDRPATRLPDCFVPFRAPSLYGNTSFAIDDSKKVFQSKDTRSLQRLAIITSVCRDWCGTNCHSVGQWLQQIAPDDFHAILETDWLKSLSDQAIGLPIVADKQPDPNDVIAKWSSAGAVLRQTRVRVVTASNFNRAIRNGQNKSDLLSDISLQLVASVIQQYADEEHVEVYCDRHGGRRFYGAALQHQFHESLLRVISETKYESHYELNSELQTIRIRFTVKGDSFTPVALSSLHAKYLRELCMGSLNDYFRRHARRGTVFKPTAGYPVDALRFLEQIADTIERKKIDQATLVRSR